MSSKPSAAELIATVQQSPNLVAVHDRAAWCSLYTREGQVNDPAGSLPHTGRAAIERFYDTFIAPNSIRFKVHNDVFCGMTVFRDLTIETGMPTGVTLNVPMHLRYDVREEDGKLKIHRLYAHWELPFMIGQLLGTGVKGLWTAIKLGPNLIKHQGFGGMLGFMRGFLGVHGAGKRAAQAFLEAVNRSDVEAAQTALAPGATLELPAGTALSLPDFILKARGLRWSKLLASGRAVTVSVKLGGERGVALFLFGDRGRKISGVQVYITC